MLLGFGEVFYGLLAQQDLHYPEHCDYVGLWHDRLPCRGTNPIRSRRWPPHRHCRHHHNCRHFLDYCAFWHVNLSDIRKVGRLTPFSIACLSKLVPWRLTEWRNSRWAWLPQLIAAFILVGSAGPKFDTSIQSTGSTSTINGNRLSFFSLCLSSAVAWAPAGADFYVYYPESTKKWKTFAMTTAGVGLAMAFANLLGVGLASGTFTDASWSAANDVSSGALVVAGYQGLGGFGKFLGVIVALGLVANNIPGTYSAALCFQVLGRYGARIPRWILSCVGVVIYTVCALGGRNNLYDIFENFLALMGYWVTIFLVITLEEHLIFRKTRGFDWTAWSDPKRLPLGLAAFTAFIIGWVGAILCMYQIYYVGPIAKLASPTGADLGIWVGCSWAMIVFPPLRWLEIRKIGR